MPGVRAAARSFLPPFYSGVESRVSLRPAAETRNIVVGLNDVEPGFFDAIGVPFVAGRDFTMAERDATGPASKTPLIVTEWLAHRLFGDHPAVGEFVTQSNGMTREIVGVVRNARHRRLLDDNSVEMAFQPFQDNMTTPLVTFVVGFSRPAAGAWPAIRQAIGRVDPTLPIFNAKSVRDGIRTEFDEDLLILRLTLVFGGLALLVAAVGLYGVLARRVGRAPARVRHPGGTRRGTWPPLASRARRGDDHGRGRSRDWRWALRLADAVHPESAVRRVQARSRPPWRWRRPS